MYGRVYGAGFVHDPCDVVPPLKKGTVVWQFTRIREDVEMGEDCKIASFVYIDRKVKIGNGVKIQNGVSVFTGVTIEDDVFVGPHVVFTNVRHPRAWIDRKHEFEPTLLRVGCSIGAGAVIRCGVTIGEYALVAAGAIVTHDVGNYELVAGAPARRVQWVCRCGKPLVEREGCLFSCSECAEQYEWHSEKGMEWR